MSCGHYCSGSVRLDRQYWVSTHSPNEFVSGYQERFLIAIKVDLAFDPIAPTANIESINDRSKAKSINRFLWGGRTLDQLDARAPRVSDICERDASRLVLADWLIELDALRFDLLDEGL